MFFQGFGEINALFLGVKGSQNPLWVSILDRGQPGDVNALGLGFVVYSNNFIPFSRCPCVRLCVRPSVTFCFLNITKRHCWNFIKYSGIQDKLFS